MESIKFDFNNLFSFSVGSQHGVDDKELEEISGAAKEAHQHLLKILKHSRSRIKLGLEWAKLPEQEAGIIKEIQKLGSGIAAKFDNVISLGIGGSYLGLRAAQDALCPPYYNEFPVLRKKSPRIYFEGNNLDPDTLAVLLKQLNPKKTAVVVISKSGETAETKAAFLVSENWLKKKIGKHYGRQVFAITDPVSGSLRSQINLEQSKDKQSFRSLPLLKGVGGRFSELNMGLLHLAILGIDIRDVLAGAKAIARRCSREGVLQNPAYLYAVLHTILYRNKNKAIAILMPFCETLKSTADWYVQLLAESLGKKYARKIELAVDGTESWSKSEVVNLGRTPISCRGTGDLHSLQQNNIEGENNKVITFIRVEKFKRELKIPGKGDMLSGRRFSELLKLAQEATEWALVRESRPNCAIILPEVTPYHWGALLFFFEMATAFEGELLNVDAFDQPGVEGYKNYMYYKLGKAGFPEKIAQEIKNNPLSKDAKYIL
ncbi:MAG: glucose-6-phosphate isomerase [Candidatus Omnitrophota bacterium]